MLSESSARLLGGIQAGLDWQFAPNWVLGTEGQYSWLGKNNLTASPDIPNYLNHLYPDGLRAVKPESVTVIH